MPAKRISAR